MGILDDRLFDPEAYGAEGRGGLLGALPPWLFAAQQLGLPPAWGSVPATAWPAQGAAAPLPSDPSAGRPPAPAAAASAASNRAPLPALNALPSPAAANDPLAAIRAAIPQGLADNANTLLAFGGGALKGGIGQGLSDAARIGLHEADLAQRRRALAAQQAATIAAFRAAGLANPETIAAMHPALARILLAHLHAKPGS